MVIDHQKDIVIRMAEALTRKTTPLFTVPRRKSLLEGNYIGTVPEHLQHLHNLLVEVFKEAQASKNKCQKAENEFTEAQQNLLSAYTSEDRSPEDIKYYTHEYNSAEFYVNECRAVNNYTHESLLAVKIALSASIKMHLGFAPKGKLILCSNWMIAEKIVLSEFEKTDEAFLTTLAQF